MPQSPMEIALLKSRLEKLTGGPGAPAWPADRLNTNLLDEGTISQETWVGGSPALRSMVDSAKEILGVAPSARMIDRLTQAKSPLLRPQTPFGWADWGAGMLADTAQTGLAAADLAALAPIATKGYMGAMKSLGESGQVDVWHGSPKNIYYHGGEKEVTDFSRGPNRGKGLGAAFFTDDESVALDYAKTGLPRNSESLKDADIRPGHVTKAEVSIKNPLTENTEIEEIFDSPKKAFSWLEDLIDDSDAENIRYMIEDREPESEIFDALKNSKYPGALADDATESFDGHTILQAVAAAKMKYKNFTKYLEEKGFDGFIFKDMEAGGNTVIPFNKEQIKLVSRESGGVVDSLMERLKKYGPPSTGTGQKGGTVETAAGGQVEDLTRMVEMKPEVGAGVFETFGERQVAPWDSLFRYIDPAQFENYSGREMTPGLHNRLLKLDGELRSQEIRDSELLAGITNKKNRAAAEDRIVNKRNHIFSEIEALKSEPAGESIDLAEIARQIANKYDIEIAGQGIRGKKFNPEKYMSYTDKEQ